jgi:hypothetical protein
LGRKAFAYRSRRLAPRAQAVEHRRDAIECTSCGRQRALLSESESACDPESASDSESEIGFRGRASESDSASVSSPCEGAKRDGSRGGPKRAFGYSRQRQTLDFPVAHAYFRSAA